MIRLKKSFFSAPVGTKLILIPDTYELNVCDICGKKRQCDYYQSEEFEGICGPTSVFVDVCRQCKKDLEVKE